MPAVSLTAPATGRDDAAKENGDRYSQAGGQAEERDELHVARSPGLDGLEMLHAQVAELSELLLGEPLRLSKPAHANPEDELLSHKSGGSSVDCRWTFVNASGPGRHAPGNIGVSVRRQHLRHQVFDGTLAGSTRNFLFN